jgi:uncharacterized membrane protein
MQSLVNKILSFILIAAALGAIGALSYIIVTTKANEKFTEFHITNLDGKAIDYPSKLRVGEKGKVIVGVTNHEQVEASYRMEVRIDGMINNGVGPITLDDGQKWEEIISFTPDRAGDNQKVEFFLYKNGESEPYLKPLYLRLDVKE